MSSRNSVQSAAGRVVNMEEQLILRAPQGLADHIRKMLRAKQFSEEIEFKFAEGSRDAEFRLGNKTFQAALVDLPCIVETHKTLDKTTYYKSADIGQMLIIQEPDQEIPIAPDYKLSSGLNPPTRDIRRRKWRKPLDRAKMEEIEHEVTRLLKPSDNETIEIINPEDYEDAEELVVETTNSSRPERADNKIKINLVAVKEPLQEPPKREKKDKEKSTEPIEANRPAEGDEKVVEPKEKKKKTKPHKPKKEPSDAEKEKEKKPRKKKQKIDTGGDPTIPASPTTYGIPPPGISPPTVASPPTITTITSPPITGVSAPTVISPPQSMPIPFAVQPPASTQSARVQSPIEAIPIPVVSLISQTVSVTAIPTVTPIQTPVVKTPTPFPIPAPIAKPPEPIGQQVPLAPEQAALLQQHKKIQAEVTGLRVRVAEAENNVNRAPNPIIKSRAAAKLAEANDALKVKLDELATVETKIGAL